MTGFRSHFVFNRSQRNGIVVLVLVILVLQVGYFFINFSSETIVTPEQEARIELFQKQIDSIKQQQSLEITSEAVSFNPNFITDYRGYALGMSIEEIDRLHDFRAQDKWINSAEDFQEVTGVSDSLLQEMAPLFRFPEWSQRSPIQKPRLKRSAGRAATKIDLNTATAEDLQEINGIGKVLSQRIVNYRESLGGFNHEIQLFDVYGLSPEVVERTNQKFTVFQPVKERQDLNTISLLALTELPYFNYELARKIIQQRDRNGQINSFEDLTKLKGFPRDKLQGIKLYLSID